MENQNTNFTQQNISEQNAQFNNTQMPESNGMYTQNQRKGNNSFIIIILLLVIIILGWFLIRQSLRGTDEVATVEDTLNVASQDEVTPSVVNTTTSTTVNTSTQSTMSGGNIPQTLRSFSADGLVSGTYMSSVVNASATFTLVSHGDEYRCPTGQANTTQTYSASEYTSLNPTPANCLYVAPNIDAAMQNLLNHSMAAALYGPNPSVESIVVNGRIARLMTTDTTSPTYHLMVVLDTPSMSQGDSYSFLYITTENQMLISDIVQSLNL